MWIVQKTNLLESAFVEEVGCAMFGLHFALDEFELFEPSLELFLRRHHVEAIVVEVIVLIAFSEVSVCECDQSRKNFVEVDVADFFHLSQGNVFHVLVDRVVVLIAAAGIDIVDGNISIVLDQIVELGSVVEVFAADLVAVLGVVSFPVECTVADRFGLRLFKGFLLLRLAEFLAFLFQSDGFDECPE